MSVSFRQSETLCFSEPTQILGWVGDSIYDTRQRPFANQVTDVDNSKALHNYYELLLSVLRLLVSTFLSRGLRNEQCQYQMRTFLQDYRPNIVGLLKRHNGVSGHIDPESKKVLGKIVDAYVALMSMADFVEVSRISLLSHRVIADSLRSLRTKARSIQDLTASPELIYQRNLPEWTLDALFKQSTVCVREDRTRTRSRLLMTFYRPDQIGLLRGPIFEKCSIAASTFD